MLVEKAEKFGLSQNDIDFAKEFYDYNEYELALDTIVTQLYEYDLYVDEEFLEIIDKIKIKLKLPNESYLYIKELLKNNT